MRASFVRWGIDMSFEDVVAWGSFIVGLGVWIWALITFFKTPKVAFATGLERTLMMCLLIFSGIFGVLAWFFAVRPLVRSRLVELRDADSAAMQPTGSWQSHMTP
jgi:hypothetical protein